MRKYETVVVMGADLPEAKVKEEVNRIEGFLAAQGARDVKLDRWGTKELGHRMRKSSVGNYLCFTYETENARLMEALVNQLRINDTVLKFQSHRISDKVRKFKGNPRKASLGSGELDELGIADGEDFGN
jgi:ribosomal protein S6